MIIIHQVYLFLFFSSESKERGKRMSDSKAYVPPSRRKFVESNVQPEPEVSQQTFGERNEKDVRLRFNKNSWNEGTKHFRKEEPNSLSTACKKETAKTFGADDFPELELQQDQKDSKKEMIAKCGVSSLKDPGFSYLDALEKPAEIVKVENKVKKKTSIFVAKKPVVHFDKRTYDKDGWMTNDDWLFWYEFNNPSKIGSF